MGNFKNSKAETENYVILIKKKMCIENENMAEIYWVFLTL